MNEVMYFRDKLREMKLPFAGFVLNRSWARTDGFTDPEGLPLPADAPPAARSAFTKLIALANAERAMVSRDRAFLAKLQEESVGGAFALAAPYLGEAIEDLVGLGKLAAGIAWVDVDDNSD